MCRVTQWPGHIGASIGGMKCSICKMPPIDRCEYCKTYYCMCVAEIHIKGLCKKK